MPDIDWPPDFRLAVVRKLENKIIELSRMTGILLGGHFVKTEDLESALGCTLEEVRKEMP